MSPARLVPVELPDFGIPASIPTFPDGIYSSRVRTLLDRAESRGLDIVIVYADRETNYCARCQTGGQRLADRALSRLLGKDWPRDMDALEEDKA